LSFELSVGPVNFLVDPGAFLYTADPEERNLFRRTAAHSTVAIEGLEQGRLDRRRLFSLPPAGRLAVTVWETSPEEDLLEAAVVYRRSWGRSVVHRRRVCFSKTGRFWLIRDSLRAGGTRRFRCLFQFAPGLEVSLSGGTFRAESRGDGGGPGNALSIVPLSSGEFASSLVPGWFSPRYGVKAPLTTAVWEGSFREQEDFAFAILPGTRPEGDGERLEEARRLWQQWGDRSS